MKNLKYYFEKARKEGFAIGQFNFSDFTQVKGIIAAALEAKSPIILGTSEGESRFFGLEEAAALRNVLRKKTGLPIFLNLDHGKSLDYVKKAIDAGYDMVHFDGSKLPLEENIKITKEVVKYAHWRDVLVEGEVGKIGSKIEEGDLTKPEEAKKYLEKTQVDLLAPSCGNFHGIEVSGIDPHLRLDVLENIKKVAGKTFLVLHGGSGTPQDDIRGAIKLGIVKININTELRVAFSKNLRQALAALPDEIIPYKYLPKAIEFVKMVVEDKIKLFKSQNKI